MRILPRLWSMVTVTAVGAAGFQFPDCVNGPLATNTVCDIRAPPADRAAALVKALNTTEKLANLVDMSLGAERIGLPPYAWWNEALHGVAASPGVSFNRTGIPYSHATSFANTITMAAAFDDDLIYKIANVISTEARAFINAGLAGLDYWTPNINPYKDPRWGRGHEVGACFCLNLII
jgi:xylan 1,4-beta-xylosidase